LQAGVLWSVSARPVFNEPGALDLMRRTGCVMLTMGIETGSEKVLKRMRKGFTLETAQKSLRLVAESGILTSINFMSGYLQETEDDLEATLDFIDTNESYIDFIGDHTSFVWHDALTIPSEEFALALRPDKWLTPQGPAVTYDEINGRTWDDILSYKKQAFAKVESSLERFHKFGHSVREYDMFFIYKFGQGRDMCREYLAAIAGAGVDAKNYVYVNWIDLFLGNHDTGADCS
jgi:hypothetical protein